MKNAKDTGLARPSGIEARKNKKISAVLPVFPTKRVGIPFSKCFLSDLFSGKDSSYDTGKHKERTASQKY
ncbi:MAG: hypothetical protein ABH862_02425, partial [Candidatus Omnitrophota bacterium]